MEFQELAEYQTAVLHFSTFFPPQTPILGPQSSQKARFMHVTAWDHSFFQMSGLGLLVAAIMCQSRPKSKSI